MQTQNSLLTLTPEPDPIFVRASVASTCNLNCLYCPKKEGMENRVPAYLQGKDLSAAQYTANLTHLARNGITGVSFTGGEPTLNSELPKIVAAARKIFQRVELTTNGWRLEEMLPYLYPNLDLLKVSLDAVDARMVTEITKGTPLEAERAIASIRLGCARGLKVGVNVVVMRSNYSQIRGIIDLCREINKSGPGHAYVSLLDFYYSAEKRDFWEREFVLLDELGEAFTGLYGNPVQQERFGCRFFWFDADGVQVRFKESTGATHRAAKCQKCPLYCQEGIYGLKHSLEGWVTTCPTGDPRFGIHLTPGLEEADADRLLSDLFSDIRTAQPDADSFQTLLSTHGLVPQNIRTLPRRTDGRISRIA